MAVLHLPHVVSQDGSEIIGMMTTTDLSRYIKEKLLDNRDTFHIRSLKCCTLPKSQMKKNWL
jgi:hypothetical protein